MDIEVVMPAIGAGTTQGKILQWLKQSGDTVQVGDILAEIETDKAVIELEAVDSGVLHHIHVQAGGAEVPVGDVIATLQRLPLAGASGAAGGRAQPPSAPAASITAVAAPATIAPAPSLADVSHASAPQPAQRLFASPSARRLARIMGVDLNTLSGSGPNGRIVRVDIEQAAAQAAHAAPSAAASLMPHTPMRATIARRLVQSKQQIPHFYLTVDCRMDALMAAREQLNALAQERHRGGAISAQSTAPTPTRYSLNDMLLLAVARAVQRVPEVNAQWTDDGVLRHEHVDISVAVALESGLITPIVRSAAVLGLAELSRQVRQLTEQARAGRLRPEQYEGGSLTVSNLGMHGVKSFSAIINPPQAVILAAGAVVRQPVVQGDALAIGHVMSLTLSADHRVVDGAAGARFLKAVQHFLEQPIELIL